VQMVADISVSTPSIAAMQLNAPWQKILQFISSQEIAIIGRYQNELARQHDLLAHYIGILANFRYILKNILTQLDNHGQKMHASFIQALAATNQKIDYLQNIILARDPAQPLKLGYCLALLNGKIIKKTAQVLIGDQIEVKLSDGKLMSEVKKIQK